MYSKLFEQYYASIWWELYIGSICVFNKKQQNLNGPDKSLSSAQNRDALCRHKNCITICGVGKPSLHNGTSINNRKSRDTSNMVTQHEDKHN